MKSETDILSPAYIERGGCEKEDVVVVFARERDANGKGGGE